LEYSTYYTAYQREYAHGLALCDALGVNLDPSIIWNAIPWSFVLDWVANVGEYLSRFKTGFMDPTINIHQYCWSVKRERDIFVSYESTLPGIGANSTQYPAVNETAYRREVDFPSASSILTSGLSLNELSLAAALVLSRRPKHRSSLSWFKAAERSTKHAK
jgi:hypothetical protein